MDSTGMELGFMGGQVMSSGMGVYLLLTIPAMLLSLYAQARVKSAFGQWSQRENQRGLTGAEAAADMLRREGVNDVRIERVDGFLSDHYDPRDKVLRLSSGVFDQRSVAALGIACHEAGHALQHAHGYGPLGMRSLLVPLVGFGSKLAWPIIIGGLALNVTGLAMAGVAVFGLTVLFQLVTLPVEFNASSRAKEALIRNGITTDPEEQKGVASVLGAAALTYVAATVAAIGQMLYYVMLISGRRRN